MKTTLKSTLKALLTLTFILTLLLNGTAFALSAFDQTAAQVAVGYAFNADWRVQAQWMQSRGTVFLDSGPGSHDDLRTEVGRVQLQGQVLPRWRSMMGCSSPPTATSARPCSSACCARPTPGWFCSSTCTPSSRK